MELSTFAYIVAILELLVGIPLLFYRKRTLKWIDKTCKDETLLRILGVFLTVLGALVLLDDYEVSLDTDGIVRILAWIVFIKGILNAWWPQATTKIKKEIVKNEVFMTLASLFAIFLGGWLLFVGPML